MITDLHVDFKEAVTTPYYQLQAADGSLGSHITSGFIHVVGGQYFISQADIGSARGVIFNCVEGLQCSQYYYDVNGTAAGSGGANAITIKMTSDGVTAIQNARVGLYNGSVLIGYGITDSSGNTSGFSADNGTYTLVATASGFLNFSTSITVSAPATFTETMTAATPITPPTNPSLCRVYGYFLGPFALPRMGVKVTCTIVPTTPSANPVTSGGNVVSIIPESAFTDQSGFVYMDVIRTDALDDTCTYTIASDDGAINKTGVTLTSSTKDLSTL